MGEEEVGEKDMVEKERFKKLLDLGAELSETRDVDLLLERILTRARELVSADAGSVYTKEGDVLRFNTAQNDSLSKGLPSGKKLIYSTFTVPANSDSIAGHVALTGEAVNIADVYELPDTVPYSFDKNYDDMSKYRTRSMLTAPLKTNRGVVVGVIQLINREDAGGGVVPFPKGDEPLIGFFAAAAAGALERALLTKTMILRMIKMAELRDPSETGPHVNRVSSYAAEMYEEYAERKDIVGGELERELDLLKMAAMLHDVGKIAISDKILKKPGRLDEEERGVMEQHTYLGARLFMDASSDFDDAAREVALNHHEKWDGTGYPGHIDLATAEPLAGYEVEGGGARGKKGEEIHLFGRIVALADVYDALRSNRSYKHAWDESRVVDIIKEESGRHFDPEMVDIFFTVLDRIKAAAERYPDH